MCDPVTAIMGAAGAGLSLAGGGLKAEGALAAAAAKAQDYVANAEFSQLQAQDFGQRSEVASSNLDLLRTQAAAARLNIPIVEAKGRLQEARLVEQGDRVESAQVVHFAYSNIDPSFGSPLVLAAKTAGDIQTDVNLNRAATGIAKAQALTQVANIEQQGLGMAEEAVTSRQNALLTIKRGQTYAGDVSGAARAGQIGAAAGFLSGVEGAFNSVSRAIPSSGISFGK